jgi:two-component system cell cycle sensor histidine kinase/response regulator CckA
MLPGRAIGRGQVRALNGRRGFRPSLSNLLVLTLAPMVACGAIAALLGLACGWPGDGASAGAENRPLAVALAAVAGMAALVTSGVWYRARVRMGRYLEALTRATERYAAGDLGARTGLPYGPDELGTLARVLDEMAERVQRQVQERERLQEALRQAQKLDALGRLAGGIAHDFNNLLTAILSYGRFLREDLPPDDPRQEDVAEILRGAERAAALTKQLLAFSRKQPSAPQVVELNPLVEGMEKLLRRVIGEQYELVVRRGEGIPPVLIEPNQLEQALVNLVVNARDATPGGGRIEVETGHGLRQGPDGVVAEHAFLAVADHGVGMGPEVQAHLFEPFFTTKERGKGTGLGLATVFGSIRSAGGSIAVESEPGKGSRFCIWLPPAAEQPHETVTGGLTPGPRGLGQTLLVVEDDEGVRALAARALAGHGYRVLTAGHSAEALAVSRSAGGPIDLLITDVVMPGMGGPELARALVAERPEVAVLFVTGHAGGQLPPGAALLEKPFTPAQLVSRVRQILSP